MAIKSRIGKILLIFGVIIAVLVVGAGIMVAVVSEPIPAGETGAEAEKRAKEMKAAVNFEAWENLHFLAWEFPRGHKYVWDRKAHEVEVKWDENRVLLKPDEMRGVCYVDGQVESFENADEEAERIQKAFHLFANDSFWLTAFTKLDDSGVELRAVDTEAGDRGLLVTYTSGGVTPGDSYLWILDENGRPKAWKLWVQIIPLGGIQFTWEDWQQLPGGAWFAPMHKGALFDVDIKNVRGGTSLEEVGAPVDLFRPLH